MELASSLRTQILTPIPFPIPTSSATSDNRRKERRSLPEAISIRQTAELLDVSKITVRRWIRHGFLKAYRLGPQIIRIPRSEIARMRAVRVDLDYSEYPRV